MADALVLAAAGSAGACLATAVAGAAWSPRKAPAEVWLERRRSPQAARTSAQLPGAWRGAARRFGAVLGPDLQRAGWSETPERLLAGIALSSLAGALLAAAVATRL